jgi:hypothetical protein
MKKGNPRDCEANQKWTPDKCLKVLREALVEYEKEHPNWCVEVLVSMIKWGLKSLRYYIEDSKDSEISWKNPFVELHYPIDWNWDGPRIASNDDQIRSGMTFGLLTKQNTADDETAKKTLAEIMVRELNALALGYLTSGVWYEIENSYYTPVLPLEHAERLNRIEDGPKRKEAFDQLARPFSIGAASIDYGTMEWLDGSPITEEVAHQLANIRNLIDIDPIRFLANVNGRKMEFSLIFQVHPLIANYDTKRAYHPITVGLFIKPDAKGNRVVAKTPARWPRAYRISLWDSLFLELGKVAAQLIPEQENEESVILTVNAQIKIPANRWHPDKRSGEIKRITDGLAQSGELSQIMVQSTEAGLAPQTRSRCLICGWLHDAAFTQILIRNGESICLRGVLPEIVRHVHACHEKGFPHLNTKDDGLLRILGSYGHASKAFYDLNQRQAYRAIFNTSRRGFISLRGFVVNNPNKS